MDDNKIDVDILQTMLDYYRRKCYQLESEYLLYKATTEKRISDIQRVADSGSNNENP
jgi:hypothetical protein